MKRKPLVLFAVLGLALLALTACSAEDVDFLQSMAQEWAHAKNVSPTNDDGSLNFGGLVNAGLSAAGAPGGDPDVTAVIDAKNVVDSVHEADVAAENAQKDLDAGHPADAAKKLDAAVSKRPNDWWLLDQAGVANLEAGSSSPGNADLTSALSAPGESTETYTRVLDHQRQLLNASVDRQRTNNGLPRCATFAALSNVYSNLYSIQRVSDQGLLRDSNAKDASVPGVTCQL
jgi:hypothetical protein